ncbi:PEP-CTERM sorting domain-containing protein [Pelomonas sp. UHG3]|uniref:PEP-CTERM sorting domain-containing protein n=1 Tax=Roseateles hydrophilus TaxID=2975054 RepID=A0ACC6CA47_9BURK|nr:PEP-CTERM sorting domain-containing protein [Pelomonas sp. UHG3]MCY4745312.1 PEP-CTERM sorting domain-containing protein [Pelomonas sp. UHG3]
MRQALFAALTLVLGMTSPAAHAAEAATAQVSISNVVVSTVALDAEPWITGAWPWLVQNTGPGWPATGESTGVTAQLTDADLLDGEQGWLGTNRQAALAHGLSSASASVSFTGGDLSSAGAASSFASASNGEVATATARLWDAAFMVGGRTRVVVTMTLDSLSAAGQGGTAMALATLGLWQNSNGAGFVNAEAQAIDAPGFSFAYTGPSTLSVSWDNPSTDTAVARITLLTSAQVLSAAPVPEPASAVLLALGLAALAWRRRR